MSKQTEDPGLDELQFTQGSLVNQVERGRLLSGLRIFPPTIKGTGSSVSLSHGPDTSDLGARPEERKGRPYQSRRPEYSSLSSHSTSSLGSLRTEPHRFLLDGPRKSRTGGPSTNFYRPPRSE